MYLKIKTEKEIRSIYFNGDYAIKFIEKGEIKWNEDDVKTFVNKEFNCLNYGNIVIKLYDKDKFDNEQPTEKGRTELVIEGEIERKQRKKLLGLCFSTITDTDLICYFIPCGDKYEAYLENDLGKTIEVLTRRSGRMIFKGGEMVQQEYVGDGKIKCKILV